MLVYGDQQRVAGAVPTAREINRQLDTVAQMAPGLERHAKLVAALVESGRLLQGIADADFEQRQVDAIGQATGAISQVLLGIGRAVCRSWDSGFGEVGQLPRLMPSESWPGDVELRVPEGFAFYALYPEAYAEAARRLKLVAPPRVIGVRSIGTALAAVVAAALGAPSFVTVRPFGDPSDRQIAIDPELERALLDGDAHYVIVDEGPGQSGSSFGAVADWLEGRGVPRERIALLPSHAGPPGPAATDERQRWWPTIQREPAEFGDRWPALIGEWCTAAIGPLDAEPREISAGAWRQLHYAREDEWPATVPAWERRKFLVSARGERFLVKFAGLGRIGTDKLAIARALHADGFVPEPVALAHGYLIERWCEDAVPLALDDKLTGEIARYIAARAAQLGAPSGSGASAEDLVEMARRNIALEFGDELTAALDPWRDKAPQLERRIVRVRTDNKLDRHEWLRANGRLIKTDGVDHHRAHDLIGCQDVAWDVAGAIVEFELGPAEASALVRWIEEAGQRIDRELLQFCRIAYLAFRMAHARLGAGTISDARERGRIARRGDGYAAELQHLLQSSRAATRHESLVG